MEHRRGASATTLIVADGIGSGLDAHVAATLCAARLFELLERDFSLIEAFGGIVGTMAPVKADGLPYTAFHVARIHTDGRATVLSYEAPTPVLIGRHHAHALRPRVIGQDNAVIHEAHCVLEPGEALLLVSDGVTQAGLGRGLANGWTVEGVCEWVNHALADRLERRLIGSMVHQQALRLWGREHGDDCTAVVASCRRGEVVNVLTGPPANPRDDAAVAGQFLRMPGRKAICGATTAKVVARAAGLALRVEQVSDSLIAPPAYSLDGIDVVTEGAVTLNQVYNILDEDPSRYGSPTGVTRLAGLLRGADRVNFFIGGAHNPAGD